MDENPRNPENSAENQKAIGALTVLPTPKINQEGGLTVRNEPDISEGMVIGILVPNSMVVVSEIVTKGNWLNKTKYAKIKFNGVDAYVLIDKEYSKFEEGKEAVKRATQYQFDQLKKELDYKKNFKPMVVTNHPHITRINGGFNYGFYPGLNLRDMPSTLRGRAIETLKPGDIVYATGNTGEDERSMGTTKWVEVIYENPTTKKPIKGWVAREASGNVYLEKK